MARLRGHSRRKKARLTNRTFSAVMDIGRDARAVDEAADAGDALETVELDILDLLRSEPDAVSVPAAYNDASSIFTAAGDFPAAQYVLGLMKCPQCYNEMVYYQDRDRLAAGYRFRCRVCQQEMLATLT